MVWNGCKWDCLWYLLGNVLKMVENCWRMNSCGVCQGFRQRWSKLVDGGKDVQFLVASQSSGCADGYLGNVLLFCLLVFVLISWVVLGKSDRLSFSSI